MPPTEKPRTSVPWDRVISHTAALMGLAASLVAMIAAVRGDLFLARPIDAVLALALIGIGFTQINCDGARRREVGEQEAARRYGRLCIGLGLGQLFAAILLPVPVIIVGAFAAIVLLPWQGLRQRVVKVRGRRRRRARVLAGTAVPTGIMLVVLAYGCLAFAAVTSKSTGGTPKGPGKGGGKSPSVGGGGQGSGDPDIEAPPTYAELCSSLPNPIAIGHGLGELFVRDGAVKAGCATQPFRVADTGIWVSAGVCLGEPRSVAVSSSRADRPAAILYGEASEFVHGAALDGTLAGVEAAEPGSGDVVLVETLEGTYGFARSTRSATPGNANATRCNEVGGTAEPFAKLPPPLVLIWRDLVRDSATWFWPTPDSGEHGESVSFISTGEVVTSVCLSAKHCALDGERESSAYDGRAFVTLPELEQFMPPEEGAGT